MKTKIISILFILVIIMSILVFCQMYNHTHSNENKNKIAIQNVSDDTSDGSGEVNYERISSQTNTYSESDYDYKEETRIVLSNDGIQIDGNNVNVNNTTATILKGGTYRVTGSIDDGRIIVNAPQENVKIILDGANITCSYSSPIYIYKSAGTMIYLESGTQNSLSDGSNYTYNDEFSSEADEEPNATLYSKSDLIISGTGTLNVKGNYSNGITSKDTLIIQDVTISVDSKNHGINGKDNNTIRNANIVVTSDGDGIRSTNDTDETMGWIRIENSNIKIESKEDAIQAETDIYINGGEYQIISGGGADTNSINNNTVGRDMWGRNSSTTSTDEISTKGIKAVRDILIKGNPTISIDSADDAIHSNGSIQIDNGNFDVSTGDDGIHADSTLTINNGTIIVKESYEGLEANNIIINDGNIDVTSSDDGVNVNGGNDGSGFGGFGNQNFKTNKASTSESNDSDFSRGQRPDNMMRQNGLEDNMTPPELPNGEQRQNRRQERTSGDSQRFGDMKNMQDYSNMLKNAENPSDSSKYKLIINGGTINVNSNGDGLDCNGYIVMNGGYVVVQGPTNSGNGALDYNSSFTVNGGTLVAIGSSGMAQGVKTSETQGSIMQNLTSVQEANTKIELKDENGKTVLEETSEKTFSSIVLTSADIKVNEKYYLYLNGSMACEVTASSDTSQQGFGMGFSRNAQIKNKGL